MSDLLAKLLITAPKTVCISLLFSICLARMLMGFFVLFFIAHACIFSGTLVLGCLNNGCDTLVSYYSGTLCILKLACFLGVVLSHVNNPLLTLPHLPPSQCKIQISLSCQPGAKVGVYERRQSQQWMKMVHFHSWSQHFVIKPPITVVNSCDTFSSLILLTFCYSVTRLSLACFCGKHWIEKLFWAPHDLSELFSFMRI